MKKTTANQKKNPESSPRGSSQNPTIIFTNAFLLKGNALYPLAQDKFNSGKSEERKFRSANELEQIILKNSKVFFGERTFFVPLQKSTESLFDKNFIPNGLLLDLGNTLKPRFYFLNVNILGQEFYSRIFPKTTRFLSYFKNKELMEKIGGVIIQDRNFKKEMKVKMSGKAISQLVKTAFIKPFILNASDSEIKELSEVKNVYSEIDQSLKCVVIRKFSNDGDTICTIAPLFSEIHSNGKKRIPNAPVTEEYHLEDASEEIKAVYKKIKVELLKVNNQLQFNPQKYYISMRKNKNLAFFHFSRKRITLVVMHPEKDTRKQIKHHEVKTLTEKVQRFWNGPSCSIVIENETHFIEVISLLKKLVKLNV